MSRYNYPPHNQRPHIVVHDHDVLSGRGVNIAHHPGNQRFRTLVTTRADESYCTSYSASEKRAVAEEIVQHIKSLDPPGRFLKRDGRGQVSRGLAGPWEVLTERECIKKACQALRDCNRLDRQGYANGVAVPEDVAEVAKNRQEMGLTGKQQAARAAAEAAAAQAAATIPNNKRDWGRVSPSVENAAEWLKKQRTDDTGTPTTAAITPSNSGSGDHQIKNGGHHQLSYDAATVGVHLPYDAIVPPTHSQYVAAPMPSNRSVYPPGTGPSPDGYAPSHATSHLDIYAPGHTAYTPAPAAYAPAPPGPMSGPPHSGFPHAPAPGTYSPVPASRRYSPVPAPESYSPVPAPESYSQAPAPESYSQAPAGQAQTAGEAAAAATLELGEHHQKQRSNQTHHSYSPGPTRQPTIYNESPNRAPAYSPAPVQPQTYAPPPGQAVAPAPTRGTGHVYSPTPLHAQGYLLSPAPTPGYAATTQGYTNSQPSAPPPYSPQGHQVGMNGGVSYQHPQSGYQQSQGHSMHQSAYPLHQPTQLAPNGSAFHGAPPRNVYGQAHGIPEAQPTYGSSAPAYQQQETSATQSYKQGNNPPSYHPQYLGIFPPGQQQQRGSSPATGADMPSTSAQRSEGNFTQSTDYQQIAPAPPPMHDPNSMFSSNLTDTQYDHGDILGADLLISAASQSMSAPSASEAQAMVDAAVNAAAKWEEAEAARWDGETLGLP